MIVKKSNMRTYLLGFGFFAILLYETLYDNLIPLMLGNYIKNNEAKIGFLMTIDNYIALLVLPMIGFISDRLNTRFGKRMPFILIGMPLAGVLLFLLPNYTSLNSLILLIIGMNLAMLLYRSPVISLMPDITPKEKRGKANSIINFVGGFGAVIATLFGLTLFEKKEQYPFYIAGVLVLISFIVIFISIKEKRDVIEYEKQDKNEGIFSSFKNGFNRKEVVLILLAICSWFIAYNGIQTFFSRYGRLFLEISDSEIGLTLTCMSLPFLLFALPAGLIGSKYGKKKTMAVGLIGVILMMPVLVFTRDLMIIRICFVIIGLSWALVNINSFPFVANLAPIGKIGAYTGLYYLFSTFARIVSPPLLGFVIDLTSFGSMFIYSGVFFLIALILLFYVKVDKKI
ncbi:MAG: Major Facilitator Superfamily transporter [Haloplasmataceae bacterium]|jgi:MFS family permease|nr:Major Facilitator Superfamily transporter [Haloplasmataceae bacterium]